MALADVLIRLLVELGGDMEWVEEPKLTTDGWRASVRRKPATGYNDRLVWTVEYRQKVGCVACQAPSQMVLGLLESVYLRRVALLRVAERVLDALLEA